MQIIFVPGGGASNNQLSSDSLSRIKKSLDLAEQIKIDRFFLSGGNVAANQTKSEAELMADYLKTNDVAILFVLDMESRNTWENIDALFEYLFRELKNNFLISDLTQKLEISVASDRWHLRRIRHLIDVRLYQYRKSISGQVEFYYIDSSFHPTIKRFLYEIVAFAITWLDPWGQSWIVRRNRKNRTQTS